MSDDHPDDLPAQAFRPPPRDARWRQLDLGLARRHGDALPAARAVFGRVTPALYRWQRDGRLHGWFFMRKPPDLRLRLWLAPAAERLADVAEGLLRELLDAGEVRSVAAARYRPETARFGGAAALDLVHAWFHVDSVLWWSLQRERPARVDTGEVLLPAVLHHLFTRCCGGHGAAAAWQRFAALAAVAGAPPAPPARPTPPPCLAALAEEAAADAALHRALAGWALAGELLAEGLAGLAADGRCGRPVAEVAATAALFSCNRHGLAGRRSAPMAGRVLAALRAGKR